MFLIYIRLFFKMKSFPNFTFKTENIGMIQIFLLKLGQGVFTGSVVIPAWGMHD